MSEQVLIAVIIVNTKTFRIIDRFPITVCLVVLYCSFIKHVFMSINTALFRLHVKTLVFVLLLNSLNNETVSN